MLNETLTLLFATPIFHACMVSIDISFSAIAFMKFQVQTGDPHRETFLCLKVNN